MFSQTFTSISKQVDDISNCSKYVQNEINNIVNEYNMYGGTYNMIMFDIRDIIYDYFQNKKVEYLINKYNISLDDATYYFNEYYITKKLYICTNWLAFFDK